MDDAIVGTVVDALPQNAVVGKGSVLLQFCKRPIRNESKGAVYHKRLSVERLLPTEVVCLLCMCSRYIIIGILAAHPQRVALPAEGQRPRAILTMQRVGNVVSRREERDYYRCFEVRGARYDRCSSRCEVRGARYDRCSSRCEVRRCEISVALLILF